MVVKYRPHCWKVCQPGDRTTMHLMDEEKRRYRNVPVLLCRSRRCITPLSGILLRMQIGMNQWKSLLRTPDGALKKTDQRGQSTNNRFAGVQRAAPPHLVFIIHLFFGLLFLIRGSLKYMLLFFFLTTASSWRLVLFSSSHIRSHSFFSLIRLI